MNYLAHLVLSGADAQIRMGNLMGDFTTGRLDHPRFSHLPARVRLGLALHRWIDHATDQEPKILQQIEQLRPSFGKWTPIILDIVGDYYILKHWDMWGLGPWDTFEAQVYADLQSEYDWSPEQMKPLLDSLLTHRWLAGYGTPEGIVRAVQSVQKRANLEIPWQGIPRLLTEDTTGFSAEFCAVFKDFLPKSDAFIQSNWMFDT